MAHPTKPQENASTESRVTNQIPPPCSGRGLGGRPQDTSRIIYGPSTTQKRERARELRQNMTPAERLLWQHLRDGQLSGLHFRRQQVIDGLIVDFYCHQAGIVVEVDGGVHDERREHDADRDRILRARELVVLRFRNEQVFTEVGKVLETISQTAEERQALPR